MNSKERERAEYGRYSESKHPLRNALDYLKPIVIGASVGMGFGLLFNAAANLDQLLNPQLVDLMRNNTEWYQYISTRHAITPVILDHPIQVTEISTFVGALVGAIDHKFS